MPITVTNLTCVYGAGTPFETTALRDVSVTVENGSFVGILGRTGCGKSTLIQIMAGLLTPTAGTVMLDGQDIHARRYDRSILRRKVGIVFQYPECQLFETTVEKDVAFGLKHSGLSAAEKQARVRAGRSRPWASRSRKSTTSRRWASPAGRSGAWPSRACWRRSRSI